MIATIKARLEDGKIIDWEHQVWSNTHSMRPGRAGHLLAAQSLAQPFAAPPPQPLPLPEGGGDRNAVPLYALPNVRVVENFIPAMPLRVSALRSLGAYTNVFAIESFMDELAAAAGADPVAFRLKHLDDPRAVAVVQRAAERFGWNAFRKSPGRGRGFAFARYKNLATYTAVAVAVEAAPDGNLRLLRATAAVDSGEVVNPDGIRNQIEGGIVQAASWTLLEAVQFDRTRVTSRDWNGYPILRFSGVPERIDVEIIDRPGQPFLGAGEAAHGPAAAALANAVADARGVRARDLPLQPIRPLGTPHRSTPQTSTRT
jgi:CO/xanthine dehydrogenase Mo-binding subunit